MPPMIARTPLGPIEYRREGSGPAVLVLNGGHCSRRTRLSHERLAEAGFTVLTPSRPGYDNTPADTGRSAQAAADALAALLETLHIPTAAVIGISAAGPTALALAQRHPDQVRQLILESAVTLAWDEPTKRGSRLGFGRAERLTWGLVKLMLRLAPMTMMHVMLSALTTLSAGEVLRRMSPTDRLFVRRMLEASQSGQGFVLDVEHQVTEFAHIRMPVLVMFSPQDKAVPPRHAHHMAQMLPQAELVPMAAESHLIWIGPAAEQVWRKRLDFLRSA